MDSQCMTSTFKEYPNQDSEHLESLIFQIAEGDKTALSEIYHQTKSAVYGCALSVLKNPQDAEDILQDTYIKLFQSACTYQAQGKPLAFLYTIAKNLCLMKLRKDKRSAYLPPEEWDNYLKEKEGITAEDKIMLYGYIELLSAEEQEIAILHASGFKHREIAEATELPLSTVLSKYNRAIKKLAQYFKEGE